MMNNRLSSLFPEDHYQESWHDDEMGVLFTLNRTGDNTVNISIEGCTKAPLAGGGYEAVPVVGDTATITRDADDGVYVLQFHDDNDGFTGKDKFLSLFLEAATAEGLIEPVEVSR